MPEEIDLKEVVVNPKQEERKKTWWGKKTGAQKFSFIASIVILILSISAVFVWAYCRYIFGNEIGDAVLGSYIDKDNNEVFFKTGWDLIGYKMSSSLISWIATLFIIAITITIVFISNVLIHLFTNKKSRKSQTIGSLSKSLVKYISIIVAVGFILAVWGVDVAGIVAGVGVLTLIVGLGCQTLIQDVISGLFIVFDDYFAVGDMVIIDGFRGTITEVGLKTTKLQDAGGNIKSISNSQIATVVNLSRIDSMVTVTIRCAYEEDIVRVEGVIAEAMESFRQKIPSITDGPYYKGIDNIGASSIDFLVLAYCKEANRFQVTRDLKRELILLFRKNDIIIPFTQITVNKENPSNRPTASDVQKLWAKKATNANRGLNENKPNNQPKRRGKKFLRKVASSVKAAAEEIENE